jgi:L-alanine-DL-glutamate epimerase-like enolase superfamily enzyme
LIACSTRTEEAIVRTTVRLYAADLHYPKDLELFTAVSGPVSSLSARYLAIERSDGFSGIGEVRANITYLSHLPESAVDPAIIGLCRLLPWDAAPEEIRDAVKNRRVDTPHVATAVVENALVEGMARGSSMPVAQWLGGVWRDGVTTNQCLFWNPDETFDRLAQRFLAEGFRQLKVRIAVGAFDQDLARLKRLRAMAGPDISIAADANGAWDAGEAIEKLRLLEPIEPSYIEQPTKPGDWGAFRKALAATSIPLMADEGLASEADVEALCGIGSSALAHLKIVKLGGLGAVIDAVRRCRDAGVGVMIGQMNEGAMATAITVHSVMALAPLSAELYGCYGLLDDVTQGVSYRGGKVSTLPGAGLGVHFDPARCRTVWSEEFRG